jgi:transcription antitermination factor NusG
MQMIRTDEIYGCSEAQIGGDWYALYTKHRHEKMVARNLTYKGFETFVPLYQAVRNWKDRVKQVYMPLFPCYVFFKGDLGRRLDIVKVPGVFSLVFDGGRPAAILASEIESIRRAVGSGARLEPHPFLSCGDRVRIKRGPLTGIEGILIRRKGSYRLILSADLLEKSIAVEVDAFSVVPLPRRAGQAHFSSVRSPSGFQEYSFL